MKTKDAVTTTEETTGEDMWLVTVVLVEEEDIST